MQIIQHAISLLISGDTEVYFLAFSTLRFASASVFVSAIVGIPIGLLLSFSKFPGRKPVIVLVNGMMAVPTVVVGLFIYSLFSRSGIFRFVPIMFTPAAVILGQSLFAAPVVISLTVSGLNRIDSRFAESLFTLDFSGFQYYVMAAREGGDEIFHAALTSFGRVIGEVGVLMMLGGNIRWYTRTLTTAIVLETGKGHVDFALALGIILLLIAVSIYATLYLVAEGGRKRRHV